MQFNSPQWRQLVKHAAAECQRLGLELCIHNCGGWSSSGGPWNTPEHGMQIVVTSEKLLHGPAHFDDRLPQPPANHGAYRDIAVLALPATAGEKPAQSFRARRASIISPARRSWSGQGSFARMSGLRPGRFGGRYLAKADRQPHGPPRRADGRLVWDVPAGDWTVLRVGHACNGCQNHPAPPEGTGLECDKLSREAAERPLGRHV